MSTYKPEISNSDAIQVTVIVLTGILDRLEKLARIQEAKNQPIKFDAHKMLVEEALKGYKALQTSSADEMSQMQAKGQGKSS